MPSHLTALLDELADGLPGVTKKRMFGHDALFAFGNIFALEWEGRVGARVPDADAHARLMAEPGADRFDPMSSGKGMSHWVILPEDWVDEPARLRDAVTLAHRLNAALPPKEPKRRARRGG